MSSVKPNTRESKRRFSGPNEFQLSHATQNTVMYTRNCGVPMNRAMPSAILPKVSRSTWIRGIRERRVSFGVSRRSAMKRSGSRRLTGDDGGLVVVVRLAPVLGQQVVQDVVDADRAEQPSLSVHDW